MQLRPEDITEILRIFAKSDLEDLYLDVEGTRLDLSKSAGTRRVAGAAVAQPAPGAQTVADVPADPASSEAPAPTSEQEPPGGTSDPGLHELRSPVLGVFYRRPAPGQPPFVEVGTEVGADDPVCVVDVMKMFTKVSAGVAGRIAEIRAEDGDLVEHGQVLMRIEVQ